MWSSYDLLRSDRSIKKTHTKNKKLKNKNEFSIIMNFVSLSIVGNEFQILVKGYHDVRS